MGKRFEQSRGFSIHRFEKWMTAGCLRALAGTNMQISWTVEPNRPSIVSDRPRD
jgi:hypothetical protein